MPRRDGLKKRLSRRRRKVRGRQRARLKLEKKAA